MAAHWAALAQIGLCDRQLKSDFDGRGGLRRASLADQDIAACWARWLDWAGLEQVGTLQRIAKQ